MFCLFYFQVCEKSAFVLLDFGIFSLLDILNGIWLSVLNRQEFLYVHIFIGIFFVFVVFAYTNVELVHK